MPARHVTRKHADEQIRFITRNVSTSGLQTLKMTHGEWMSAETHRQTTTGVFD
ncbi:endonuclease I [Salmonella phage 21]|nr:endonuclease I [Salmonella phage 21]